MSTITREFTKEQLISAANARMEFAEMMMAKDLLPLQIRNWSIEAELARIALASLEAELVAYMYKDNLHADARFSLHTRFGNWSQEDINEYEITEIPLYTTPPAPGVPDECPVEIRELMASHSDALFHDGDAQEIWNACRAAMLQGAAGNSPVIPDGWVACSERMPHIGMPVITCCGDVVQYAAYAWDGKEWQDWYEEYDKLPASAFTHWHPRPAAPQQK